MTAQMPERELFVVETGKPRRSENYADPGDCGQPASWVL